MLSSVYRIVATKKFSHAMGLSRASVPHVSSSLQKARQKVGLLASSHRAGQDRRNHYQGLFHGLHGLARG